MNKNGIITGVVMVLIFVAGFFLGQSTANDDSIIPDLGNQQSSEEAAESSAPTDQSVSGNSSGQTINTSNLTDGQRKMLETVGIDADSITITPEMVTCAEEKIGADRVAEIKNGDSPSFLEAGKLATCYSGN